jgi:hypothetical protein
LPKDPSSTGRERRDLETNEEKAKKKKKKKRKRKKREIICSFASFSLHYSLQTFMCFQIYQSIEKSAFK